jgi:formylglycine-generating enzyme required for sulfatase activity
MRLRRAWVALLVGAASALVACNAILGIDLVDDKDGGTDGATTGDGATSGDATADGADATSTGQGDAGGGADAAADTGADATLGDGGGDAPGDGPPFFPDALPGDGSAADAQDGGIIVTHCLHPCIAGTSTCVDGGISLCQMVPEGDSGQLCETRLPPVACSGGDVCRGASNNAACCNGTGAGCAPSCQGGPPADAGLDGGDGLTSCGADGGESCCTSLPVPQGNYLRSYDGVRNDDATHPATVSAFELDKYEVTVGRFRKFVGAWIGGWTPRGLGDGIHTHLNGGSGLVDSSQDGGAYEPGWSAAWNGDFPQSPDPIAWNGYLICDGVRSTWTGTPGANERLPMNCVDWYAAYAFCIWDGGFLPSETEWDYAAAGGGDTLGQRVYAWSSPPSSTVIDCTYADYQGCSSAPLAVGSAPKGAGRWGQLDLTGNVWEWTLDYYATYVTPCHDCGFFSDVSLGRTIRGASYNYPANQLYVGTRVGDADTVKFSNDGLRCARSP